MQRPGSSDARECQLATNPQMDSRGGGRQAQDEHGGEWLPSQPGSPLIRAGVCSPAREATATGGGTLGSLRGHAVSQALPHFSPHAGGGAEDACESPLSTPSSAGYYDASPPSGVACSSPDGWQGRGARRRGKRHAIFDLQVAQEEGGGPPAAAPGSPPASESGRRQTPGEAAEPTAHVRPLLGRKAALWPSLLQSLLLLAGA